jgi:hypothetical protein
MHGFHEYEFRFVMLINKFTWKNSPLNSQDLGRDDIKSVHANICRLAIECTETKSIVVFTLAVDDFTKACNMGELEDGDWNAEPETRYQWSAFICPLLDVEASDAPGIKRNDSSIKDILTWDMSPKKPVDVDTTECEFLSEFGLCQCQRNFSN